MCKIIITFIALFFSVAVNAQPKQFKALLVTSTKGWHHESVHDGVVALRLMANKHYFEVELWQDPNGFIDAYLEQFKVIIFLNTTGDIFDSTQQKVMERFIKSGKGFVGIHSASDTEYDWEWYTKLVGRMFYIHPAIQTATLQINDSAFPGLQGFANNKQWTDEWYEFGQEKVEGLQTILSVDETSYQPKVTWGKKIGNGMGASHPIAWYHHFDGGRSFYTALGHLPAIYTDPAFLNHVYAGIFWAATGKK